MRYDDRLLTLLSQPLPDNSARAALWAQLVDLAAQPGPSADAEGRAGLLDAIDELQPFVPVEKRAQVSRAVARKATGAAAVEALGRDSVSVAAPVLAVAHLPEADWLAIIPALPIASRALLRERRDLPASAMQMLSGFGSSDFALPGLAGEAEPLLAGTTPIGEMVARIEAFQRQRASTPLPLIADLPVPSDHAEGFRFETDRDGMICWVDGVERGAMIGLSLSELAIPGMFGVDGHAAGAFRQRAGFVDARLVVGGQGKAAGNWLIRGEPRFNADDGRFLGYRGIGRRPLSAEHLNTPPQGGTGLGNSGDSMRQLAHELRTPLNAIAGFAQMIDQQYLGPAGHAYRERARAILVDTAQLSHMIESADISSQLDAGKISRDFLASTDLASVMERIAQEFEPLTERQGVNLRIFLNPGLPRVSVAAENCHRMLARLIACLLDYAVADEVITARAAHGPLGIAFSIDRPALLKGISDAALFERGAVQEVRAVRQSGLGLAFSLRLVERLAAATGARLTGSPAQLTLILPPTQDSARQVEGG